MSQHDSIDFGNRPPTGSAAPPRRGELEFASIFEKLPSSPIGSATGATKSPASCPFHLLLCGSVPLWCASNSPASCPFPALLDAPNPCRNRLTFTLTLSDHHFSQAVKIQTHRLNGSNLIKPNQSKKTLRPGPRPPSRPACRHRRSCLGVRRHVAQFQSADVSAHSTWPRQPLSLSISCHTPQKTPQIRSPKSAKTPAKPTIVNLRQP
jgi:hypothetical protein